MNESDFDFEVAASLRTSIGSHLGISGDFMQGGKIIQLFGMGKPTAAAQAGLKLGYSPRQAAALLVVTEKFAYDEENKGFFKMFNAKVAAKKSDLENLLTAFAPEISLIKAEAITLFVKTYLPLVQAATDELEEGRAALRATRR
jgi:hypothetical protein